MNGELADLRLQLERIRYDSKEAQITTDSLKEQNAELERELEDLRVRPVFAVADSEPPTDAEKCPAEIARGRQSDAKDGGPGGQGQEEGRTHGRHDGGSRCGTCFLLVDTTVIIR